MAAAADFLQEFQAFQAEWAATKLTNDQMLTAFITMKGQSQAGTSSAPPVLNQYQQVQYFNTTVSKFPHEKPDDVLTWFTKFESSYEQVFGINVHHEAANVYQPILRTMMQGVAYEFVDSGNYVNAAYNDLKDALVSRFGKTEFQLASEFQSCAQKEGESLLDFLDRIQQLVAQTQPGDQAAQVRLQLGVRQQYGEKLANRRADLKSRGTQSTFPGAVEFLRELAIGNGEQRTNGSVKQQAGKSGAVTTDHSGLTCHNCGQKGHIRPNCPQLKRDGGASGDNTTRAGTPAQAPASAAAPAPTNGATNGASTGTAGVANRRGARVSWLDDVGCNMFEEMCSELDQVYDQLQACEAQSVLDSGGVTADQFHEMVKANIRAQPADMQQPLAKAYAVVMNAFGKSGEGVIAGEDDEFIYKRIRKPPTTQGLVEKVKMSVPVVQMAQKDLAIRAYFVWLLLKLCKQQGMSLIVPEGLRVQRVSEQDFTAASVEKQLRESGGGGNQGAAAAPGVSGVQRPRETEESAQSKRARFGKEAAQYVQVLKDVVASVASGAAVNELAQIADLSQTVLDQSKSHSTDLGQSGTDHYFVKGQIYTDGDKAPKKVQVMYDNGSTHTLVTEGFCQEHGLDISPFKGSFRVAHDQSVNYSGQVKGAYLQLGPLVTFHLQHLRVIPSSTSKFILGNDVVRSGGSPSFRGMQIQEDKWYMNFYIQDLDCYQMIECSTGRGCVPVRISALAGVETCCAHVNEQTNDGALDLTALEDGVA